jgi:hypothetical protein
MIDGKGRIVLRSAMGQGPFYLAQYPIKDVLALLPHDKSMEQEYAGHLKRFGTNPLAMERWPLRARQLQRSSSKSMDRVMIPRELRKSDNKSVLYANIGGVNLLFLHGTPKERERAVENVKSVLQRELGPAQKPVNIILPTKKNIEEAFKMQRFGERVRTGPRGPLYPKHRRVGRKPL